MDYETYRRSHFADPPPEPRFNVRSVAGATLYFEQYDAAIAFYTEVLGEPAYTEGEGTRGWRLGDSWLTLLAGGDGGPRNTEIGILASTPDEAQRLQQAFVDAGGTATDASDALMYEPIRACPVTDPFGTELLVYAPLDR